jgi:hypothetical protein
MQNLSKLLPVILSVPQAHRPHLLKKNILFQEYTSNSSQDQQFPIAVR